MSNAQIELLAKLRDLARRGTAGAGPALARLEAAFECRCNNEAACDKCAVQCRYLNLLPAVHALAGATA